MPVNWTMDPFGIIGTIGSLVNTKQTNKTNLQIARETNAANRQMVEQQNKAAREESEKAYRRSSAPNQVALMTAAGMSRAGAINALNGGGSYTPAPVNVSQDSAPQMQTADFSALSNVMQISRQKAAEKHDEKMQEMQIKAAKEQQKAQQEHDLKMLNQTQTLDYKKHLETLGFEREKWDYLAPLQKEQLKAVIDNLNVENDLKEEQKRDLIYKVDEYQSKQNRDMRDAEALMRSIASKYNYNISQKDFYDYRDKNYMPIYENGEIVAYEPRRLNKTDNAFSHVADRFWSMIGNIIPIEYLGKIIKSIF